MWGGRAYAHAEERPHEQVASEDSQTERRGEDVRFEGAYKG